MKKEQVFPSFRRQNKWLGIIDYKSLVVFGIYIYIIYLVCIGLEIPVKQGVIIMLMAVIPLIAIYFANSKEESIIDIVFTILRFCISKKKYYYKIERGEEFDININKKTRQRFSVDKILKLLKI